MTAVFRRVVVFTLRRVPKQSTIFLFARDLVYGNINHLGMFASTRLQVQKELLFGNMHFLNSTNTIVAVVLVIFLVSDP